MIKIINESEEPRKPETYVIKAFDDDKSLLKLLEYLKSNSDGGHSFNVEVDPNDSEYHRSFFIDGDGADQIISIEEKSDESNE